MASGTDGFAKWAETPKQGALRFTLKYGVLMWGVTTAILYTLLMWLMGVGEIQRLLLLSLVLFPIGGLAWGGVMWWIAERRYRRHLGAGRWPE